MPCEHRFVQFERVEYGKNVVAKPVGVVSSGGDTGRAEATPRNAIHVVADGKLRREIVKQVSCAAEASQEDNRAPGASPIEHLQPDVFIHGYKLHFVWGWVVPDSGFLRAERRDKRSDG
jgi:hypothetical protein